MIDLVLALLLAANVQPQEIATSATTTATPAAAAAAEEDDPDPMVCRSRLIQSYTVGQRFRRERICKTRSEWAEERGRGRRGND